MILLRRITTWVYDKSFWLGPLWLALILYLSTSPLNEAPTINIPGFDKVVHLSLYMVLTIFLYSLFQRQQRWIIRPGQSWLAAGLCSTGYGGALELVQEFLARYREGDWFDFLANMAGAFLAWLVYKLLVQPRS